jgi:hypothetical protein
MDLVGFTDGHRASPLNLGKLSATVHDFLEKSCTVAESLRSYRIHNRKLIQLFYGTNRGQASDNLKRKI